MIRPAAAARMGVPDGAAMSIPSCMRPHRQPKPLVTTPLTGQMKPLDDDPSPVEPPPEPPLAAESAPRAAALSAAMASTSSSAWWRFDRTQARTLCTAVAWRPRARSGCATRASLAVDLLGGLAGKDLGLVGDLDLRQPRLLARDPELVPEGLDLLRDRLVLAPDRLEVLELVDEVAEALDLEEDPERVGVLGLVELDQPLLEPGLCDRELALEVRSIPSV